VRECHFFLSFLCFVVFKNKPGILLEGTERRIMRSKNIALQQSLGRFCKKQKIIFVFFVLLLFFLNRHTTGTPPKPRWGHSAVVCGHLMYIFGGRDRVGNFQDLNCFNFETRNWRRVEIDGIDARFFSSLSVFENMAFVFGGRNIHSFAFNDTLRVCLNDDGNENGDLIALIGDPSLADVVFVMPADETDEEQLAGSIAIPEEFAKSRRIFAHKSIVCCRSPTLSVMLGSQMKEGQSGVVAMRGVTAKMVRALLVYLYADRLCVNDADSLMALLALANQWQLFHLKQICQERMANYISLENVSVTLAASHQLDASHLFLVCRAFMHKNAKLLNLDNLSPELQASVLSLASPPRPRRGVD
jgi:hypothetical protein